MTSDQTLFDEIVRDCSVGYLTLATDEGWPRSVALNFAAVGGDVVFHGALSGEKHDLLTSEPRAGFTMVKEYSFIPSTWNSPDNACPATCFFKSIEIRGTGQVIEDPAFKAVALQALMDKYQPAGGFQPIDPDLPLYLNALRHVGVFRVRTESWTRKVKFAQDKPVRLRRMLVEKLRERGAAIDHATAQEVESTLTG